MKPKKLAKILKKHPGSFVELADYESSLDTDMEEEGWWIIRIICKAAIGLSILLVAWMAIPWERF